MNRRSALGARLKLIEAQRAREIKRFEEWLRGLSDEDLHRLAAEVEDATRLHGEDRWYIEARGRGRVRIRK